MKTSTQMVLRALLKTCSAEEQAALSHYLSPEEAEALEELPEPYGNPLSHSDEDFLSHIHPSWMSPFLRTLSEKDIGLFLASLNPSQAAALTKDLLYSGQLPTLTSAGKNYLQKTLLDHLTKEPEDLLPLPLLPKSPLNVLLDLTHETVALLLHFLGLHDFSIEVKQIIEKQKLNKIYEALSPAQLNYLKILLQSPEPVTFAPMGLNQWNGDQEKLRALLLQRSANRLGKALFGQDPSFIWHLLHKLHIEQALLVQKLSTPLENSRATAILITQILEFISYTRQHHG